MSKIVKKIRVKISFVMCSEENGKCEDFLEEVLFKFEQTEDAKTRTMLNRDAISEEKLLKLLKDIVEILEEG